MIIHVGFLQCWPMMCRKKHTKTQMGRFIDTVEPLYTRVDVRLLDIVLSSSSYHFHHHASLTEVCR